MSDLMFHVLLVLAIILQAISIIRLNMKFSILLEASEKDVEAIKKIFNITSKYMHECSDTIDSVTKAQSSEIARLNNSLTPRIIRVEKDISNLMNKEK